MREKLLSSFIDICTCSLHTVHRAIKTQSESSFIINVKKVIFKFYKTFLLAAMIMRMQQAQWTTCYNSDDSWKVNWHLTTYVNDDPVLGENTEMQTVYLQNLQESSECSQWSGQVFVLFLRLSNRTWKAEEW